MRFADRWEAIAFELGRSVNVYCTRCAQWVGTDHVCDSAHCVVCEVHGITIASHRSTVARNLGREESAL